MKNIRKKKVTAALLVALATAGAQAQQTVSLRGLGSAGTLVLVNNRRLTPSAYADPNTGNSTVYNLNAIPIDAIDRIEVLKDGASAIYGSDAMAGVVNIILRRDCAFGGPSDALPRFRGNLASSWSRGPIALTGRVNYVRGWFDGNGSGTCFFTPNQLIDPDCRVKPWTTVDLGVSYTGIKNLTLGVLVRNVTDKSAPYDPQFSVTTAAGFNAQFHNALGRYYTPGRGWSSARAPP